METIDYDKEFIDNRFDSDIPLRQAQLVLLRTLKIFDKICQKHGLEYFLDYGTLLGAVRHQGFIPWDDDLDVSMTRKDYDKLQEIIQDELPDSLFFQSKKTVPKFKNNIIRIVDRKSTAIAKGKKESDYKWHMGVFFDIFPIDETNHPKRVKSAMNFFYYKYDNKAKRAIMKLFRHLAVFVVRKQNVFKLANYFLSLGKSKTKKYLVHGLDLYTGSETFTKEDIFPTQRIKFEDGEFSVPNNYKKVLVEEFGDDYMSLPPENNRISHFGHIYIDRECEFEKNLQLELSES
ncbi:MAG: LicD family protein [Marinifilaceae bacterium]|jgi:lipopolysaccharide cholinephosphotransferase|nr:LicD family protein [Marinifilaceae bacterium]